MNARIIRAWLVASLLAGLVLPLARADENASPVGKPLSIVLDELRQSGLELVYSTALVSEDMRVLSQPQSGDLPGQAREILQPFGLGLLESDGLFLVVRQRGSSTDGDAGSILVHVRNYGVITSVDSLSIEMSPDLSDMEMIAPGLYQFGSATPGKYRITVVAVGYASAQREVNLDSGGTEIFSVELNQGPGAIEVINVSVSRYVLFSNSRFFIDQKALQALPDLGDDPVRSAHRLPGVAASGLSSQPHFRGGEKNETAIYMNGLKLTDPFHIRDYHSIFSLIDSRAISGVEAYTGGFPVQFGDQTSGVLLLESQRPEEPLQTELGLSFYNASFKIPESAKEKKPSGCSPPVAATCRLWSTRRLASLTTSISSRNWVSI